MSRLKNPILFVSLLLSFPLIAQNLENGAAVFQKCIECHGENAQGLQEKNAPKIAGQYDWYIISSIEDFKAGRRENPEMMPFIRDLSDQDISDVAAYVAKMD